MPRGKHLAYYLAVLAMLPVVIFYLDDSVKMLILSVQGHRGVAVARWVSLAGYGPVDAAIAIAVLAVGLLSGRVREAVAGRLALFAVITGGISVQVLKYSFCRSRPLSEGAGRFFSGFPCLGKGYGLVSFPSGHTVTAFALAYVLAQAYPKWSLACYMLAAIVAVSRVYLASHFLSDVVAGAAIGLSAGWIVCRLAAHPLWNDPD